MRLPNIGLTERQSISAIADLNVMLANLYVLQVKTKKAQWDLVGPMSLPLRKLFRKQHKALLRAGDDVAERIRMLGGYPIGTARGFLDLASIEEHPGEVRKATQAIVGLLEDHEHLARELLKCVQRWANVEPGTADLLTTLMRAHHARAYELRSCLEGEGVQPDGAVELPAPLTPTMA
jgi:starvation-inducible DNA-binding protein